MAIVIFLGRDVNEYEKEGIEKIKEHIKKGEIRCDICTRELKKHSSYERGIKETGQRIKITIMRCKSCNRGHGLLPDFMLPRKHYSGNEIESVIIDSAASKTSEIETEASESTARRWIRAIGESIDGAVGILKYVYMQAGSKISEVYVTASTKYGILEQVLEVAPAAIKYSGNKLGLANIWLGKNGRGSYI